MSVNWKVFASAGIALIVGWALPSSCEEGRADSKIIYQEGIGVFKFTNGPQVKIPNIIKISISKNHDLVLVESYAQDAEDPQHRYLFKKYKFVKGDNEDWTVETLNFNDETVSYTAHVKFDKNNLVNMKRTETSEGLTEVADMKILGKSGFRYQAVGIGEMDKKKYTFKMETHAIKGSQFEEKLHKTGIRELSKEEKLARLRRLNYRM
jgi:hypothetical protein